MLISQHAKWSILISFILIGAIWFLSDVLLPFLIGAAIAYFLNPIADKLERIGINRLISTIIIFGTFVLCLLSFSVLVLPKIANEIFSFWENIPVIINKFIDILKVTNSDKQNILIKKILKYCNNKYSNLNIKPLIHILLN